MNKYARHPDAIVDLHGRTTAEATTILGELLSANRVHVRIIVGKGNHSKSGPVLRDFVKQYLSAHDVHFSQSKLSDGGEGSLEVYL